MRLSNSRRCRRSDRRARFSPGATSDHNPRATVGIPMPCDASKVISTASAAAPKASGDGGILLKIPAARRPAASQLAPRISQRAKWSF